MDAVVFYSRGVDIMGLLRGIFWTAAAVATGGLVLALLPNDWDGIDFNDGGGDE